MQQPPVLQAWIPELLAAVAQSRALLVAVFTIDGRLEYANEGMMPLLNNERPTANVINPKFETLKQDNKADGLVFNGMMTFGQDTSTKNITAKAQVHRRNQQLLVIGEADVDQLRLQQQNLLGLNQEISHLQRQLIKEKKRLEQTLAKLKETQTMLIHSEKMNAMGQLVAGIAHEINTPLAYAASNIHSMATSFADINLAFDGTAELISTQAAPLCNSYNALLEEHDIPFIRDDFNDMIQASLKGLNSVKHIVDQLRDFSRLDKADVQQVKILDCVNSTLALAMPQMQQQGLRVSIEIAEDLIVSCFPRELNQVLLILVINAGQAIEHGHGCICLKAEKRKSSVLIQVMDNGKGIEPEVMARIFDPFFTTKPVGSGTGLGLSIAHNIIVELHGGALYAQSHAGQGCTFNIELPLR